MFKIEFEINGRKVNPDSIGDAIEKAVVESVSKEIEERVTRSVGHSNAGKIKITAKGRNLNSLSYEVSGPEELVEKVKKAFQ